MDKQILRQAAERHPSAILQPYDILMEQSGFDTLYTLWETLGSTTIYVPSIRRMLMDCLAKEAIREFNGYNYKDLAKKYGFSERHLRRLLTGT